MDRSRLGERLRIGLIAPPFFAVPPTGYGGVELVVSYLADGLVERGHDVTLFASGGSRTKAKLSSVYDVPPSAAIGQSVYDTRHLIEAYKYADAFDIIHDHTVSGLLAGASIATPVVHTIHGPLVGEFAKLYEDIRDRIPLIAISEHQRSTLPRGVPATVIYNGVNVGDIPFSPTAGNYLLFVGRVNPEKGLLHAIEIARASGMHLKMLLKINEEPERLYFREEVEPALHGMDAEVVEQVTFDDKMRYYRDAFATLFPIQWDEPFGLVMIESMATGTPVIAFARGAAPEVVGHGDGGFVCQTVQEAVEWLAQVPTLDRARCRQRVVERFTAEINVRCHEDFYYRILSGPATSEQ
ncbi:hypothetical protein AYO38_08205 [bacterium SCGC AG-212-C10]|nr:hypothetical protein AYO38_08205 [bacterium SCGC AG-212-C10]